VIPNPTLPLFNFEIKLEHKNQERGQNSVKQNQTEGQNPMSFQPKRPLPEPLRGKEPGSFAENTITVRIPRIGRQVLAENDLPETAVFAMQELLDEIPEGKIRPLPDPHAPDAAAWNEALQPYLSQNWLEPPWFIVETYFYRRIISAVDYFATGFDPFAKQKLEGLHKTIKRIRAISHHLAQALDDGWQPAHFLTLLKQDLWGNQVDLSLWSAEDRPDHDVAAQDDFLLVDDGTAVTHHLSSLTTNSLRVDFIVDNAAFELIGDLCLADYLLSSNRVQQVHLHLKMHPTFVSDATMQDVADTIAFLKNDADAATQAMGERLERWGENGRFHLNTHPFWTSPQAMWHMPQNLRQALTKSQLIISKGDANYRRSLGDAHWPYTTPINEIVSYFPAPIVFLRTCKSNVIAGLLPNQQEAVTAQDPNWLYNGKWGVLQFT